MTAHAHAVNVPGCYRCELSADEARNNRREAIATTAIHEVLCGCKDPDHAEDDYRYGSAAGRALFAVHQFDRGWRS